MTIQDLLRQDLKIWVCSIVLGIVLVISTGIGEFVFAIVGVAMAISVVYKVKNISKLTKGNILDEITKSFMIYIFIPMQSVVGIVLSYWFVCDFFF